MSSKNTQFQVGNKPWNAELAGTGVCKPNCGSFKRGQQSRRKLPIGTVRVRHDKAGRLRAWVKIDEQGNSYDWALRAVLVWEETHGPLSQGWLVHHKNHNALDDKPKNLEALDRAGHLKAHRPEFEERRRNAASKATTKRHQQNRLAKAAGTPA